MPQAGSLGLGGLTRCKAVAREAALRGHEVSFFCHPGVADRFRELSNSIHSAPVPPIRGYGAAPNFRVSDSIIIRGMDDVNYLRATVSTELALYRALKPDVIFTENQFSSAISSSIASIPLVTTAASVNLASFSSPLYADRESVPGVEHNFNIVRRENGLPDILSITDLYHGGSAINVAPTLREIEPQLAQLPNLIYVGPLLDSSIEIGPLPDVLKDIQTLKAIYVYMSVGTLTPEEYVPIICVASDIGNLSFVVALRQDNYRGSPLPQTIGRVRLFQTLPGLTTIKKCALVITRGGQNTLMGCILSQRPVLGFPGTSAEADFNLRSVENFCEIVRHPTSDFLSHHLVTLVTQTMAAGIGPAYADLGGRLRSGGGAAAVLTAIEKRL
jgi:UDP:flavonoid glycosyltransferase YjiC (YdhE family)